MTIQALASVLLLAIAMSGCAPTTNALFETARYAIQGNKSSDQPRLNPAFRYLRATTSGTPSYLALGYVEKHPQGPIEVWYSGQSQVLRLQNGRLVGAAGLTTEWRSVSLPDLPSWSTIARAAAATRWIRVRDVMPGYRAGVRDTLVLSSSPPPSRSALQNLDATTLSWFEERVEPDALARGADKYRDLPVSRYAVSIRDGIETVVYAEQCLSVDLCITWQRWPLQPAASKDAK